MIGGGACQGIWRSGRSGSAGRSCSHNISHLRAKRCPVPFQDAATRERLIERVRDRAEKKFHALERKEYEATLVLMGEAERRAR